MSQTFNSKAGSKTVILRRAVTNLIHGQGAIRYPPLKPAEFVRDLFSVKGGQGMSCLAD